MELLTVGGKPKIFGTLEPGKIVGRMKLGESLAEGEPPRLGVRTKDVVEAFFGFLEPPRISSDAVLRKANAKGVGKATFAYTTGTPAVASPRSAPAFTSPFRARETTFSSPSRPSPTWPTSRTVAKSR